LEVLDYLLFINSILLSGFVYI